MSLNLFARLFAGAVILLLLIQVLLDYLRKKRTVQTRFRSLLHGFLGKFSARL